MKQVKESWRRGGLVAALCAALGASTFGQDAKTPPVPPPSLVVTAGVSQTYARMSTHFKGIGFIPATLKSWRYEQDDEAALLPPCGTSLVFRIAITSNKVDRTVRFEGNVTDYNGIELQKVKVDIPVKAGEKAEREIAVKPEEKHRGPFYLRGTWTEANGPLIGTLDAAAGQANEHGIVEDFEQAKFVRPGDPLQSAASAKRRGEMGLAVRLDLQVQAQKTRKPDGAVAPTNGVVMGTQRIPLNVTLPGRPVKIGLWVKSPAPVRMKMAVHDPGIEVNQVITPDAWTVGSVAIEAGDWRYVEYPMPGYGRPLAERKPYGEANGVVDYPLTLEGFIAEGPVGTVILVDDVDVWTQDGPETSLRTRIAAAKPEGILYSDDAFNVVVENWWLWSGPAQVALHGEMEDIAGKRWPLCQGSVSVQAGDEAVLAVEAKKLPLGGYDVVVEAVAPTLLCTNAAIKTRMLVYEPGGKRLSPQELALRLEDRDWLVGNLGFNSDIVFVPWHSLDGSPAVEPSMGLWRYDWIAPSLTGRKEAGLEVMGRLGYTPTWASVDAMWNKSMGGWFGNSASMPARTTYWEEYVLRTVERFAGTVDTWVVWDRPDSGNLNVSPEDFAEKMLEVAAKAAHEANPKVKIISGGVTRENIEKYLVALSETGVSRYLNGIGLLPTSAPLSPEDGDLEVVLSRAQKIRRQEQLTPELVVLNLDWATGEGQHLVSEFDQARYVARAYAICRAHGIDRIHLQADGHREQCVRDSAFFVYADGARFGVKPAALAARTVREMLGKAAFAGEVFLNDRRDDVARCYLYKPAGGGVLAAVWRREGESLLSLPQKPERVVDLFGNAVETRPGKDGPEVRLTPEPRYIVFGGDDAAGLARKLARAPVHYADAPESAWKGAFTFHLDVGDAADELAAGYSTQGGRPVGPIDSYYHTDYGRRVLDSGRQFAKDQEERFSIDVSAYGKSDLILRRRVDYSVPDQRVKVFCNDQPVGQWFTWKSDPRFRWRDTEFVIPNRFFAGKAAAVIRVVAQGNTTSYQYWAGPLGAKAVYVSDLSWLVAASGYGSGALRDKNILGGGLKLYKKTTEKFDKGIGTMAAANPGDSLVVVGLNQQYSRFKATVGIDAAAGGKGSVRFRVTMGTIDGLKTIYDSKDMTYYSESQDIDVDVSDGIVLMLWAGDAGDGNEDDLADWINARLELK